MRATRKAKIRLLFLLVTIMLVHVVSGHPSEIATSNITYMPVGKNQKKFYTVPTVVKPVDHEYTGSSYDSQTSDKKTFASLDEAHEEDGSPHRRVARKADPNSCEGLITKIIANKLQVPESKVTPASDLRKNLGCDSLDCVEIAQALDDKMDLEIPDDDFKRFHTVGDIIRYCEKRGTEFP